MSKQYLNQGDLVKYHIETPSLNELGFKLGQFYRVEKSPFLGLEAKVGNRAVVIQMTNGVLTDAADHFAKHNCPVVLPLGRTK